MLLEGIGRVQWHELGQKDLQECIFSSLGATWFKDLDLCERNLSRNFKESIGNALGSVRGVVVIATAQLHSTKPELRFGAGSNPASGVSEI